MHNLHLEEHEGKKNQDRKLHVLWRPVTSNAHGWFRSGVVTCLMRGDGDGVFMGLQGAQVCAVLLPGR